MASKVSARQQISPYHDKIVTCYLRNNAFRDVPTEICGVIYHFYFPCIITLLSDEWWQKASTELGRGLYFGSWKPKYECMLNVFDILGCDMHDLTPSSTVVLFLYGQGDEDKAGRFLDLMVNWLDEAHNKHVFTKLAILRLLSKVIDKFPIEALHKLKGRLIQIMVTQLWKERKEEFRNFVTPTLLKLWRATQIDLGANDQSSNLIRHAFQEALLRADPAARHADMLFDFMAKATMSKDIPSEQVWWMIPREHRGWRTLPFSALGVLGRAVDPAERSWSMSACKVVHALQRVPVPRDDFADTDRHTRGVQDRVRLVQDLYKQMMQHKVTKKRLLVAKQEYDEELAILNGAPRRRSSVEWVEL